MAKRYLTFLLVREGEKTNVWDVVTQRDHKFLGVVRWFGRWRRYAFRPINETIWSHGCLAECEAFLKHANAEHRAMREAATK